MPAYGLRPGLHCCIANGRAAFLDIEADRYFGLPAALEDLFAAFLQTPSLAHTEVGISQMAPFIRSGILTPSVAVSVLPIAGSSPTATRSLYDASAPKTQVHLIPNALLSQGLAAYRLKRQPLKRILDHVRTRKHCAASINQGLPLRAIATFLGTRRLIPANSHCLRWSLALVHFLAQQKVYPDLVLGVRMGPFAAHAWVQHGDLVLNDDLDHVRQYTPILVV